MVKQGSSSLQAFRASPAGAFTLMQLSVSDVGILAADNKGGPASVSFLAAGGRLLLTAGLGAGLRAGLGADSGAALATGFG